jgi:hypothetical protein
MGGAMLPEAPATAAIPEVPPAPTVMPPEITGSVVPPQPPPPPPHAAVMGGIRAMPQPTPRPLMGKPARR